MSNIPESSLSINQAQPQAQLLDLKRAIALYDTEISRLTLAKTRAMQMHGHIIQSMLSIHKLPAEILQETCKYLVCDTEDSIVCVAPSQVCKYWRATLVECPSLWAFVVIRCGSSTAWLRLTEFVCRLRNYYPYQLHLFFDEPSTTELFLSSPIIRLNSNITSLLLSMHTTKCATLVEAFLEQHNLPILHTINYTFSKERVHDDDTEDETDDEDEIFLPDLTKFPALQSLSLSFNPPIKDFSHIRVNWSRLKSLKISNTSSCDSYLDVLEQCQSLECLSITPGGSHTSFDEEDPPRLTLPVLKEYTLNTEDIPLLSMLTIFPPHVQKLECYLESPFWCEYDWGSTYGDMFNYFASSLRTVNLSGHLFWSFVTFGDLQEMTNLTHLRLVGPRFRNDNRWHVDSPNQHVQYEEVFRELIVKRRRKAPLPNLQVFEILECPNISRSECEAIVDMMESRTPRKGGMLKKVVITPEYSSKPIIDALEACNRQGMVLQADFVYGLH